MELRDPARQWHRVLCRAGAPPGGQGGGRPVAVRDIDDCVAKLRNFTVTLSSDGKPEAKGGGANVLDSPLLALAYLAETLGKQARSAPVQAGEIVTTGTLTAPRPVSPGETWATVLDGIDLPGLSITFT